MADSNIVTIRFALNLPTEEPAFVDIDFSDARQARRAINNILTANGPLVAIKNLHDIPVLIRSADVSAAFPIDYDVLDTEVDDEIEA